MTDLEIIAACDAGPDSMVALGLPKPKTLADIVSMMWAAQDRLTATERARLKSRDRMELDYMASATKLTNAYPKRRPLPFPNGQKTST
jgi:hypothetical protein